jgi:hypothetical protein
VIGLCLCRVVCPSVCCLCCCKLPYCHIVSSCRPTALPMRAIMNADEICLCRLDRPVLSSRVLGRSVLRGCLMMSTRRQSIAKTGPGHCYDYSGAGLAFVRSHAQFLAFARPIRASDCRAWVGRF